MSLKNILAIVSGITVLTLEGSIRVNMEKNGLVYRFQQPDQIRIEPKRTELCYELKVFDPAIVETYFSPK